MKLQRLTVQNFLRLQDIDIDLDTSAVHLFCGPNEAGKSTVAESVRFALIGDSPRVALKKNYPLLVNRNGKKGSVTLTFDGVTVHRDVRSGALKDEFKLGAEQELSARIALGAQGFVDLKPDERRSLLFKLAQIKVTADDVVQRMVRDYDVHADIAARYRSYLAGGMEPALKAAEADVSRLRAKWEEIAGEKYGSAKAVDWKPTFQPGAKRPIRTTPDDIALMKSRAGEIGERIEAATQAIGTASATEARKAEVERDIGTVKEALAGLAEAKKQLTEITPRVEAKQEDLSTKTFMLTQVRAAKSVVTCPSCDANLKMGEGGELEFADPASLNFSGENESRIEAEIAAERRQLDALVRERDRLAATVESGESATQRLQDLQARLHGLGIDSKTVDEIKAERENYRAALAQAQQSIRRAEEDNATLDHFEKSEAAAKEAHEAILRTQVAIEALSPDGIKAELLEAVIGPINKRMEASAHLAGWLAPALTEEMDVVREDGLPYELLSESAQWRISAVVADAIASMSGVRLLILDRMDVVDVDTRPMVLKWACHLAQSDFDTVLVMATLRTKPQANGPYEVHWMGQPDAAGAAA